MHAASIRERAPFPWGLDTGTDTAPGEVPPHAAQLANLAIREVEVLRQVDLIAPPHAADLAEPHRRLLSGQVTSGDHLRLPQVTALDGPAVRAAIGRILGAGTDQPCGSPEVAIKEARMRRVLLALESAVAGIQHGAKHGVGPGSRY